LFIFISLPSGKGGMRRKRFQERNALEGGSARLPAIIAPSLPKLFTHHKKRPGFSPGLFIYGWQVK
jgi:hypothetical protein